MVPTLTMFGRVSECTLPGSKPLACTEVAVTLVIMAAAGSALAAGCYTVSKMVAPALGPGPFASGLAQGLPAGPAGVPGESRAAGAARWTGVRIRSRPGRRRSRPVRRSAEDHLRRIVDLGHPTGLPCSRP